VKLVRLFGFIIKEFKKLQEGSKGMTKSHASKMAMMLMIYFNRETETEARNSKANK
jgi:hypothetical protein